jgi:hypothetical protein
MLTGFGYKSYIFESHSTNGTPLYYQEKYFIIFKSFRFFIKTSARRVKNSKENKNKEHSRLRKSAYN